MKKNYNRISKIVVSILLGVGLLIGLGFTTFADGFDKRGGYGRDKMVMEVKIDSSDWKIFYASLKDYVDSVKKLVDSQVNAGIISKYYGEAIKNELDDAFKQISRTRTIKFMPGFGYMGNNMVYGNIGKQKGTYNNAAAYKRKRRMANNNNGYRGYANIQLTDSQWNEILPSLKDVEKQKINLYKTMLNIGLITEVQYDNMLKISGDNYNYLISNKVFRPFYGVMTILHMVD